MAGNARDRESPVKKKLSLCAFFFTVQNKFATAKKPKGWRSTSSPRKSQTSPMALFQPCSIISSSSSSFFQGSHPNLRSKVFVPKHQTHLIPNPKSRSLCTASWQEVRLVRTFFFPLGGFSCYSVFLFYLGFFFLWLWIKLAGVLIFSAIPFTAVKAIANSPLGESLQRRMEERKKFAVRNASKFKTLSEKARKQR